jgi:hypothetical protein
LNQTFLVCLKAQKNHLSQTKRIDGKYYLFLINHQYQEYQQ